MSRARLYNIFMYIICRSTALGWRNSECVCVRLIPRRWLCKQAAIALRNLLNCFGCERARAEHKVNTQEVRSAEKSWWASESYKYICVWKSTICTFEHTTACTLHSGRAQRVHKNAHLLTLYFMTFCWVRFLRRTCAYKLNTHMRRRVWRRRILCV